MKSRIAFAQFAGCFLFLSSFAVGQQTPKIPRSHPPRRPPNYSKEERIDQDNPKLHLKEFPDALRVEIDPKTGTALHPSHLPNRYWAHYRLIIFAQQGGKRFRYFYRGEMTKRPQETITGAGSNTYPEDLDYAFGKRTQPRWNDQASYDRFVKQNGIPYGATVPHPPTSVMIRVRDGKREGFLNGKRMTDAQIDEMQRRMTQNQMMQRQLMRQHQAIGMAPHIQGGRREAFLNGKRMTDAQMDEMEREHQIQQQERMDLANPQANLQQYPDALKVETEAMGTHWKLVTPKGMTERFQEHYRLKMMVALPDGKIVYYLYRNDMTTRPPGKIIAISYSGYQEDLEYIWGNRKQPRWTDQASYEQFRQQPGAAAILQNDLHLVPHDLEHMQK